MVFHVFHIDILVGVLASAFLGELADVTAKIALPFFRLAAVIEKVCHDSTALPDVHVAAACTFRSNPARAGIVVKVHRDADRLWFGLGFCDGNTGQDSVYFFWAHAASISRKGLKQIAIELFLRENR